MVALPNSERVTTASTHKPVKPNTSELLPLTSYDLIVVALSGGKDSVACLLEIVRLCRATGVPLSRVEAWHQCVDGAPGSKHVWDWPVTDAYCAALCRVLGVTYRRQWREGGLTAELLRTNERTRPVRFELSDGTVGTTGGTRGPLGTRGRHPAQSANLGTRWCSAAAKIDVCAGAVCNDPRLTSATVLFVTGERREESANRANYATVERGRRGGCGRRGGERRLRLREAAMVGLGAAELNERRLLAHIACRAHRRACLAVGAEGIAAGRREGRQQGQEGEDQRPARVLGFHARMVTQGRRGR
jgi:hypothetical protein